MKEKNPTVVCLNETKTSVEMIDANFLYTNIASAYTQFWNCSTARKGYSGTAIFSKVKPLDVKYDFGNKHIDEGRSITVEFEEFTLVVAYVPNAGDDLKRLNYRIDEWD